VKLNLFGTSGNSVWHRSPVGLLAVVPMILLTLALSGCSSWLTGILDGQPPKQATPIPSATTPPLLQTPTATAEPVKPIPGAMTIALWLPPQFNPESGTPAGNVMRTRLSAFMDANPGVLVIPRVKAASGPGGMLESLTAASAAAPGAVPAVVAFTRGDLESAALKGLILPLDGLTAINEDADWYAYARELSQVQNSTFGLPFAGDGLVLAYRPAPNTATAPMTWAELFAAKRIVILPVDDNQGLVTLALYRSAGGLLQDLQGRPTLDADYLQQVLQNYKTGIGNGIFPSSLVQLQTAGQAWQAFFEKQGDSVITWCSNYLADLPPDATVTILPSLGTEPYTMATGWSWALTDTDPLRRESSVRLMEYLSDSTFLADLTAASGYLPTRPTALAQWTNQSLQPAINQIVMAAEIRPANELLASLGPVLREAVLAIFNGQADPAQAAKSAVERLGQ